MIGPQIQLRWNRVDDIARPRNGFVASFDGEYSTRLIGATYDYFAWWARSSVFKSDLRLRRRRGPAQGGRGPGLRRQGAASDLRALLRRRRGQRARLSAPSARADGEQRQSARRPLADRRARSRHASPSGGRSAPSPSSISPRSPSIATTSSPTSSVTRPGPASAIRRRSGRSASSPAFRSIASPASRPGRCISTSGSSSDARRSDLSQRWWGDRAARSARCLRWPCSLSGAADPLHDDRRFPGATARARRARARPRMAGDLTVEGLEGSPLRALRLAKRGPRVARRGDRADRDRGDRARLDRAARRPLPHRADRARGAADRRSAEHATARLGLARGPRSPHPGARTTRARREPSLCPS